MISDGGKKSDSDIEDCKCFCLAAASDDLLSRSGFPDAGW